MAPSSLKYSLREDPVPLVFTENHFNNELLFSRLFVGHLKYVTPHTTYTKVVGKHLKNLMVLAGACFLVLFKALMSHFSMVTDFLTRVSPVMHPLTGLHLDVLLMVLNNFEPQLRTRRLLSNGRKLTILIVCALITHAPPTPLYRTSRCFSRGQLEVACPPSLSQGSRHLRYRYRTVLTHGGNAQETTPGEPLSYVACSLQQLPLRKW